MAMNRRALAGVLGASVRKMVRKAPFPPDIALLPTSSADMRVEGDLHEFLAAKTADRKDDSGTEEITYVAPAVLHALCFPSILTLLARKEVPVQPLGLVALHHEWRLVLPLPMGEAVSRHTRVVELYRDDRGTTVVVECRLSSRGVLAYREETTYLDKAGTGVPRAVVADCPRDLPEPVELRERYGVNAAGRLDIGQRAAVTLARMTPDTARQWRKLSGDANPIHVSRAVARVFGYRKLVLHGAAIDAWAAHGLGVTGDRPTEGAVTFRAPLLLPNQVELVTMDAGDAVVIEKRSGRDLVHLCYRTDEDAVETPLSSQIVLPRVDGRVSSTAVTQEMCANAVATIPGLSAEISGVKRWRTGYREAMTLLSAHDAPEYGAGCARDGVAAVRDLVRFADGRALADARPIIPADSGRIITGKNAHGVDAKHTLTLTMSGAEIAGEHLVATLHDWERAGRMQPGAREALVDMVRHPEMLDLRGWTFACLGAGAELSLVPQLLRWGATVAAVIRPTSRRIARLERIAAASPGTLYLSPADASDIVRQPEKVAGWIGGLPGRIVVVDTLYARGADFLLVAIGADLIESLVCEAKLDTVLAWLGSPSDAYLVPDVPVAQRVGRGAAGGVAAAYARIRRLSPGRSGDVYPGFVELQGPNYAAAKRIGRWRATVERAAGRQVSYNIAPMALTRSVLDAAPLKAAYGGLELLGMPPMPPDAVATLMSALLAWDLANPDAVRDSDHFLTDKAIDGGLFSSPVEPNGLMGLAVVLGAGKLLPWGR